MKKLLELDGDADVAPSEAELLALWQHVTNFVKEHKISGPESVHQCDDVILGAYEFIEGAGEIVGWFDYDDE